MRSILDRFYRAKACLPVVRAGECCPSSWDCSAWEERMRRKGECFVANNKVPDGKYYQPGDPMPEIDEGCSVACVCSAGGPDGVAKPTCAAIDCFWDTKQGYDCRDVYDDVRHCCRAGILCDSDLDEVATCTFENKTYVEGEIIDSQVRQSLVIPLLVNAVSALTGRSAGRSLSEVSLYSRLGWAAVGYQLFHNRLLFVS